MQADVLKKFETYTPGCWVALDFNNGSIDRGSIDIGDFQQTLLPGRLAVCMHVLSATCVLVTVVLS